MNQHMNKLARDHWQYIQNVLEAHDEPEEVINLARFHYNSAFIHGFKHGVEYVNENKDKLTSDDSPPDKEEWRIEDKIEEEEEVRKHYEQLGIPIGMIGWLRDTETEQPS